MIKNSKPNAAGGVKHDQEKPRWDLLPIKQIEDVVKVLTKGAVKYTDDNWMKVEKKRYISALYRHISAWRQGEVIDPEWGLPHLAHAVCSALFLMWMDDNTRVVKADAPKEQKTMCDKCKHDDTPRNKRRLIGSPCFSCIPYAYVYERDKRKTSKLCNFESKTGIEKSLENYNSKTFDLGLPGGNKTVIDVRKDQESIDTFEKLNPGCDVKDFDKNEKDGRQEIPRRMEILDILENTADKEVDSWNCGKCKYALLTLGQDPCRNCLDVIKDEGRINWEPKDNE